MFTEQEGSNIIGTWTGEKHGSWKRSTGVSNGWTYEDSV